ncbi:MAG: hypothetical protein AAF153_00505 [Pseudomonadota bacterium]
MKRTANNLTEAYHNACAATNDLAKDLRFIVANISAERTPQITLKLVEVNKKIINSIDGLVKIGKKLNLDAKYNTEQSEINTKIKSQSTNSNNDSHKYDTNKSNAKNATISVNNSKINVDQMLNKIAKDIAKNKKIINSITMPTAYASA